MKRSVIFVGLAAIAMSFSTIAQAAPVEVNLCTGASGKPYHQVGQMIAEAARGSNVKVNVIADTGGTWGNIQRTVLNSQDAEGSCDAMIGQPDGPVVLKRQQPGEARKLRQIGQLHREYLQVLCNAKSKVSDLYDLDSDDTVAIGEPGSGAWLIWQNFVAEDDGYSKIKTSNDSGSLALAAVAQGDATCMLVPAGVPDPVVAEADQYYAGEIILAGATDKDFNDAVDLKGDKLYEFTKLPGGKYKNSFQSGWFGGSTPETVSWLAGVYVNSERITDNKVLGDLIRAVNRAKLQAQAEFGK